MLPTFAYRTLYENGCQDYSCFFFLVLFFFFGRASSSHAEEVSWRSWCHAVLKIFVFPEGIAAGTTSSDSGEEEEGEEWICSYTLFPHNSALLSSAEVASLCHVHTRSE